MIPEAAFYAAEVLDRQRPIVSHENRHLLDEAIDYLKLVGTVLRNDAERAQREREAAKAWYVAPERVEGLQQPQEQREAPQGGPALPVVGFEPPGMQVRPFSGELQDDR